MPLKDESRRYRVVVFYHPYLPSSIRGTPSRLSEKDTDRIRMVCVTSYPFGKDSYTYDQAVDVLSIFTARWQAGGGEPCMEPYAESVEAAPGPDGPPRRFTLADVVGSRRADALLKRLAGATPATPGGRREASSRRRVSSLFRCDEEDDGD